MTKRQIGPRVGILGAKGEESANRLPFLPPIERSEPLREVLQEGAIANP